MTTQNEITAEALHNKKNYSITSLEEEIRADRHCSALLKHFHQHLLHELKTDPLEAGSLAAGADYFLREFIIGSQRENILDIPALRVRQFGGNWYIIRNLEPNMDELTDMMLGTAAFYRYCATQKLIEVTTAEEITQECAQLDDFAKRIEEFHDISGDGYKDWDQCCPLEKTK